MSGTPGAGAGAGGGDHLAKKAAPKNDIVSKVVRT